MSTSRPIAAPADFPRVYFNRFKRKGKGGSDVIEYACCSYDSHTNEMGKSVKTNTVRIGVIRSEDGLGTIEFNDLFLRKHPHFEKIEARRVQAGKKGSSDVVFFAKDEGDPLSDAKPQEVQPASASFAGSRIIKIGLACFLDGLYRSSLVCKAFDLALEQDDKLRADIASLLMHAVSNRAEDLHHMQSWAGDRILPSETSFDKDCLNRILERLDGDFILRFYQNMQAVIRHELESKRVNPFYDLPLLLDTFGSSARQPQGLHKGGVMVLFEPQTCQAWFHREINSGQDECFKAVLEHSRHYHFPALITADHKHWSVRHVSLCYQNGCTFLFEAKLQATALKKLIKDHASDLYAGNECELIESGDEECYGFRLERLWSWYVPEAGRTKRSLIYFYIFFNHQKFMPAGKKLFKIKEEINTLCDECNEANEVPALTSACKKKPVFSAQQNRLIQDGFIELNPATGRYEIHKEQLFCYQMLQSCRILASNEEMPVKKACYTHRKLDVFKGCGRVFKQELMRGDDEEPASSHHEAVLFLKTCAAGLLSQICFKVNQYNQDRPEPEQLRFEGDSIRKTLASLDDM